MNLNELTSTPLPIIAAVSRVVTKVCDRITGDRGDFPLLVCAATQDALSRLGIQSRIMYGPAAWIEILEDQTPIWAGCWNGNFSFWIATQYGEVVDLNTAIAHRKRPQSPLYQLEKKSIYSPPIVWSKEVPSFYRYKPEGIAELEITEEADKKRLTEILRETREKIAQVQTLLSQPENEWEFPNEPILCPGKRLLDDSNQTFQHFDRALSVRGLPTAPF